MTSRSVRGTEDDVENSTKLHGQGHCWGRSDLDVTRQRFVRKVCHPSEPLLGYGRQTRGRGLNPGFVALGRQDASGVQGAAVGPVRDVRLCAMCPRRQGSTNLHLRPAGRVVREGVGRAQAVALAVVVPCCFHEASERRAEAREADADRLEPDLVRTPEGNQWRVLQSRKRRSAPRATRARVERRRRRGRSRRAATCLMCPRRTTFSMVRSRSSSHAPSVGVLAIVGDDVGVDPKHHTCGFEAQEHDRRVTRPRRPQPWCPQQAGAPPTGLGWTTARFSIHGSRGRTHTIRSGCTPFASSHTIPSVAVFPDPTTT